MSGRINPGIPIIMTGMGDLLFAVMFWLFMADGNQTWNIIAGVLVVFGLGTVGFGIFKLLRNM